MQIKYGYTVDTVFRIRNSVEGLRQGRRKKIVPWEVEVKKGLRIIV